MESRDAPGVHVSQEKHVQIQHCIEHQGDAEKGNEAHDDGVVSVIHDEEDARGDAGQPHHHDDDYGALRGHEAVVTQRVKDGDVAISGDGAQKGERRHHGAADHHIDYVVQVTQHARVQVQEPVVTEKHEYGFHNVADTHKHVGHGQAADEVVHGRVQVAVLNDGQNHQDVFYEADDPQRQEQLLWDADLNATKQVSLSDSGVGLVFLCYVTELHMENRGVMHGAVGHFHARLLSNNSA